MIELLAFLGFLILIATGLLVADNFKNHIAAKNKQLTRDNKELRQLLGWVNTELQAQVAAGNTDVNYAAQLITESGLITPTRKEIR